MENIILVAVKAILFLTIAQSVGAVTINILNLIKNKNRNGIPGIVCINKKLAGFSNLHIVNNRWRE